MLKELFSKIWVWLKAQRWDVVVVLALYSAAASLKSRLGNRIGLFLFLLIVLAVVNHIHKTVKANKG